MADSVVLKLDNVSKSFAKVEKDEITHALSSISLEMKSGEFISLVGTSGCGKSTILRLIAGLITPTVGTLSVNDKEITGPAPDRGMVFQRPTLFPWLTVEKNIGFSLKMQNKLKGNELVLIPILMFIFSIGGTTYGMCEETVPFYLLLAATMVAAGFDSLTGAAVVLLGAGCGVLGSTVNPFAVGVAVDALSGVGIAVNQAIIIALGAILWLVTITISIIFVMRYAKKVKADKGPPSCRCRSSRR